MAFYKDNGNIAALSNGLIVILEHPEKAGKSVQD
jgi:hypothetical protein